MLGQLQEVPLILSMMNLRYVKIVTHGVYWNRYLTQAVLRYFSLVSAMVLLVFESMVPLGNINGFEVHQAKHIVNSTCLTI